MAVNDRGLNQPSFDELVEVAGSKFALVVIASKRARQLNAHAQALGEGLLEYVGPTVEVHQGDKPISTALREVVAGNIEVTPIEGRGDGEALPAAQRDGWAG